MEFLEYDIIEKILFKIHRFNYLGKISKINKEFNKITKSILNFHYNKLNKALETEEKDNKENIRLYNNISKYLFNYKILNLKYYNFNKRNNISTFIKIIILYDEICSTKKKNLNIIKYNDYNKFLEYDEIYNYVPFMIIYIKTGYSLHLEYNYKLETYRLCLNNPLNNIKLNKIVDLEKIIKIISYSENGLFSFIYNSYLTNFFKK